MNMGARPILALAIGSALPALGLRSIQLEQGGYLPFYTFSEFVVEFNRTYEEGSDHWQMREELFKKRLGEMIQHNANPEHTWKMGITKFMDFTEVERKRLLGYRGRGSR